MNIAAIQFEPIFGDISTNENKIINFIEKSKSDILVFPELALSGYDFIDRAEATKYALEFDSDFFNKFKELSKNLNKIIVLGFAEKYKDKVYNSAGIFFPDSKYNRVYRKVHLFYKEIFIFDESDIGFFNIYYKDWDVNIGTMICYDWRFPEAARTLALMGADIIVCPSNLVTTVWDISMPSRALENKVYLLVSNRIGIENRKGEELVFNGASKIYSYNGSVMAEASKSEEMVISAEIEPAKTRNKSFNNINNIFSDRRTKFYKL